MTDTSPSAPGTGPLTYRRVIDHAWGMFREHYLRVAIVASLLFVPPVLVAAMLEGIRESLETDPSLLRGLGYALGLLVAVTIRLLGPVVFAGYLDEAVGQEYFGGPRIRLGEVLRTLPWGRLVAADVIVVLGTAVGLALFILPGVVFLTLFTLIGPVLVQERHGLVDGFRRTFELSRRSWPMILLLVVTLLVVENVVHEGVHELFHHSALHLQVISSWLVAATVGGMVGLVEVALATELMARSPLPSAERD